MENQLLDVIIVNYNSTEYTIKCIQSVLASSNSFKSHIIVIDNGSYDYPDRIKQNFPEIDLMINSKNYGFAKAVNLALERASGGIVVLLNPDTIVFDGFLKKAVHYLNANKDVAVLGPKILDWNGTVQGSARRFPTVLTSIFGRKSPLTKLFPNNPVTKREFVCFNVKGRQPVDVDWVSGACMVVRKNAMVEVGGFDERFFMYWEDTDLCKELKTRGWRTVYFPEGKIYHRIGVSSGSRMVSSVYNFHKSCFLLCEKHTRGIKRGIIPLAFFGLSIRCLFVLALNGILRLRRKTPSYRVKKQYFN